MRLHWTYSNCDRTDQERIAELWRSREAQLEAKISGRGESQTSQLRISIEHSDSPPEWNGRALLYLVPDSLTARMAHSDLTEVLDEIVGSLSHQIDTSFERQPVDRNSHRTRADGEDFVPLLESIHSEGRSDAFFSFLMPLLGGLKGYAQRELRTRRLLGELPGEQVTLRDVLDEVLLAAWTQFGNRPHRQPLDLWLVQLIDKVIDKGTEQIADVSLEARRRAPSNEPRASRQDEWVEDPTIPETIELANLLPGEPGLEMWDELDVEAKQSKLDGIFERLTRSQRQALMLSAVEGFNTATIADFQDRTEGEVSEDLAAATLVLQRMASERELPEIEEQLERADLYRPRRGHRT